MNVFLAVTENVCCSANQEYCYHDGWITHVSHHFHVAVVVGVSFSSSSSIKWHFLIDGCCALIGTIWWKRRTHHDDDDDLLFLICCYGSGRKEQIIQCERLAQRTKQATELLLLGKHHGRLIHLKDPCHFITYQEEPDGRLWASANVPTKKQR